MAASLSRPARTDGGPSDAALVSGCRAGDAHAWEQLVRRYQRLIYTVPMRFGLAEDEAADVFQQTCLRLFERLETIQQPERVGAWLISTSRRLSLDALARRRGEQPSGDESEQNEYPSDDPAVEESLLALEEQQRIRRAVDRLDGRCRALIHHLFYDPSEPSYEHIAATLGMPKGSIGPVRARCFAKVKALLEER